MGARFRLLSDVDRSRYMSRCLLPPLRRKFPRPFVRESSGDCRNHLGYAVSAGHRSGVAAGRGSRAGLTGWYSVGENERQYGEYRQDCERGA
jgi:hypothetical protein